MKLSVVIVNYNVKFYLEQCLHSLYVALGNIEAEVFVVDNHSHDGSVNYLKRLFPHVHFIASQHNLGFARANNLALKQSRGEYVLLLNPDTIVSEDSIRSSVSFMESHPQAGALGVQMIDDRGEKAMESRRGLPSPLVAFYKMAGLCKRFPNHAKFAHYYMGGLPWDIPGKIEVISGAYCFLRKTALDRAGLLDEDFFMYGEDIDLSCRLLKVGFENWYLPVRILHYKGESTQKSSFRYVHVFYDAMFIFFRKHYGGMSMLFSIPIRLAIYVKAFLSLVSMSCQTVRKKLGFISFGAKSFPNYIFIGSHEMIERCKRMSVDKGLSAEFYPYTQENLQEEHISLMKDLETREEYTCVVYDTAVFSYQAVFDFFVLNPRSNVHMGFFYSPSGRIVTVNEVLEE